MCADPPQKGGYTSPHLQLCIGFTTGIIHNIYIYTIIYAHVCPLSRATTQSYPRNIYYYIGYIYARDSSHPRAYTDILRIAEMLLFILKHHVRGQILHDLLL
jgi:hypothetical protein